MFDRIRYLLLQIRNPGDPMRQNEINAFCRSLETTPERIRIVDLLSALPSERELAEADIVLLGGSGHYSVADEGEWLERTFDALRNIYTLRKPTFASCWGFQAFARAMGGTVVHDLSKAEVGTHHLKLTVEGQADPIFSPLGDSFCGQMGHEDYVLELPPGAIRLASSARVENQAYRFDGLPIYCTQFHPELNRDDLLGRVQAYPEYITRIAGIPPDEFCETIKETPEAEALLKRFVSAVFDE